jgi:hypothetical protein
MYEASIRSPLLFVHGNTRDKSNRSREIHRLVAGLFVYDAACVKSTRDGYVCQSGAPD